MMKRSALWVVVIPVCYMAFWFISLSLAVSAGREVVFEVEGYDPRDLLAGHYLRYRIKYSNEPLNLDRSSKNNCICFGATPSVPAKATWSGLCESKPERECGVFLKGGTSWGWGQEEFEAGIGRYYFPDEYAEKLRRVPASSTIRVAVTSNGEGIVRGMYVDGVDIVEWARR